MILYFSPDERLKNKTPKMPKVPTAPLPELTVRGTKRKNRLYCPEENIQRGLQLVREGVYVLRAARISNTPDKRLIARVNELRARGELDIYWGKNAPGYLKKFEKEKDQQGGAVSDEGTSGDANLGQNEEVSEATSSDLTKSGKKKKRKLKTYNYTPETAFAAASAVKEGLYTLNAAKNVFGVPRHILKKALLGEDINGVKKEVAKVHVKCEEKIMGKILKEVSTR